MRVNATTAARGEETRKASWRIGLRRVPRTLAKTGGSQVPKESGFADGNLAVNKRSPGRTFVTILTDLRKIRAGGSVALARGVVRLSVSRDSRTVYAGFERILANRNVTPRQALWQLRLRTWFARGPARKSMWKSGWKSSPLVTRSCWPPRPPREGSDGPAFVELLRRHQQKVWQLCYRLMGNEHDAGDAAQEVFIRLFVNRGKFEGRSKFTTWLHAIAVRTCLSLRRAHGRRRQRETTTDSTNLEGASEGQRPAQAEAMDAYHVLETLGEQDRAMLILKYAENYTFEELASMFGISKSACKMRVSRARDKIQKRFPADSEP